MRRAVNKVGLILLTVVFLAGCGKSTSDSGKTVAESIGDTVAEAPADDVSGEERKELSLSEKVMPLAEVVDEFVGNLYGSEVHEYFYTVTDLNQNGQPEILFAAFLGSGRYTYLSIYEADSEFKSAKRLEEFDCISEDAPDIIKDKLEGIYDSKEGTYSYFDTDYVRYGFSEHSSNLMALSFGEKNAVRRYLFEEYELTDDDEICMTYFDSERNEISEEEYYIKLNDIEKSYNIEYKINWKKLDELLSDMDARAEQLAEVFESQEFKVLSEEEMAKSSIESGDPELDVRIREAVRLAEDEEIRKAEWVKQNCCYRIAVSKDEENGYREAQRHDYIFIKDDSLKWFEVNYSWDDVMGDRYVGSAWDYNVIYEDVTFDGKEDVIISLGHYGVSGTEHACAYIYKDGDYVYTKSFEEIPYYSLNKKEKLIYGWYYESGDIQNDIIVKYKYEDGEFVLISREEYSDEKYGNFDFSSHIDKHETLDATSRYINISWSSCMGDLSKTCSLPEYLDSLTVGEDDNKEYDFFYAYLDIDGDGFRDIVVTESSYPIAFVVIKRKENVYGIDDYFGVALHGRQAQRIYTNGIIRSYDGGGNESYYRIRRDNEELITEDLATVTGDNQLHYTIHGKEVTEQEFDTWVKENCKEGIIFNHIDLGRY